MHRDRPPRAGLRRRHHVARDGGPQAHVAEAPSARALGGVWPDPRSRRLFDLARLRWLERALLLHGDLQVDLHLAHETPGWQADFLCEGRARGSARAGAALPGAASPIGATLGTLSPEAAEELGLTTACQVGCGLIDAHAGRARRRWAEVLNQGASALDRHIGLVAGTSTCHMALSAEPRMVPGVWGPYYGAVAPGLWLNEGGQSATGALLDHILAWHGEGRALGPAGAEAHANVIARIRALRAKEGAAVAPARAARLPRQPLAARRSACARRDQRPHPRCLVRFPGAAVRAHRGRRSCSARATSSMR